LKLKPYVGTLSCDTVPKKSGTIARRGDRNLDTHPHKSLPLADDRRYSARTRFDLLAMPALSLPPLGLYVHIPWCVRKCPYCDFNSHAAPGTLPEALPETEYLASLLADLKQDASMARGRQIGSVFFGGG